jgi:hypothetical protein
MKDIHYHAMWAKKHSSWLLESVLLLAVPIFPFPLDKEEQHRRQENNDTTATRDLLMETNRLESRPGLAVHQPPSPQQATH